MLQQTTLFRQEAVQAARDPTHGEVLLARPLSFAVVTTLFALITGALLVFITCFSYTRKVEVTGILVPMDGLIKVTAGQSGVVRSFSLEGQTVKAGDTLFTLASQRAYAPAGEEEKEVTSQLQFRRESLSGDEAQLDLQNRQKREGLDRKISILNADLVRVDDQISIQTRRVEMAHAALGRYVDLQRESFVSVSQVTDKEGDLLDQQQKLAELSGTKTNIRRELSDAQAAISDLAVQADRDRQTVRRAKSIANQELTEHKAQLQATIRAPISGVISGVSVSSGQTAAVNQTLLSIIPTGAILEAELYAPSRSIGFIRPGMRVNLRYQAYPYQKFGQYHGRVREISNAAMRPDELEAIGANKSSEPQYRVRVTLDKQQVLAYGKPISLRTGALVESSIMVDTRKIYEWLIEPIYALGGY